MTHEPMTVDQIRAAQSALDALDAVLDGLTRPRGDALTFRPMQPLPIPDFVSPKEAAAALKVHPRTIQNWIKAGRLRAVVLPNGHSRISRQAIMEILDSGAAEADRMANAS